MKGRYRNVASRAAQAASYIRPEIMATPAKTMEEFLQAEPLAEFRLLLERLLALQAAHARQERGEAAGHADRDVRGRPAGRFAS